MVNRGLIEHQSGVVLGDALRNVSGVNVQTVFGVTDFFVIRGFDSLSSGLVLTDGASEPEATFYNLYNLDRVEVLKGPGAFLYGANPLSGSVNLNRKQPVFEPMFQASGAYGPFGSLRGTVDAGWADPAQGLAARFNGLRQVSDNYRDDKHSGIWALNPAVTLRNEKTTATANLEYVTSELQVGFGAARGRRTAGRCAPYPLLPVTVRRFRPGNYPGADGSADPVVSPGHVAQ